MYEKKLIQLLCSEDYENILLALQLFEGIEEIPSHLQFALSLVGFSRIEILAETAKKLLKKRVDSDRFGMLKKSAWVLANGDSDKLTVSTQYSDGVKVHKDEALKTFYDNQANYNTLLSIHPYFIDLYLKSGNFWMYHAKIFTKETAVFFEAILHYFPTHPYALFSLAHHAYCSENQSKKAIQYYQFFLTHHSNLLPDEQMNSIYKPFFYLKIDFPTTFNAYQNIAKCYLYLWKNYATAIKYYWKAYDYSPKNPAFDFEILVELLWKHKKEGELALKLAQEGLVTLNRKDAPTERFFGMMPLALINRKKRLHELIEAIQAL